MVDAASAREDAEDATAVKTLRDRQEQERAFIEHYLKQRRGAKLNEELDQVAEDTRHVCMQTLLADVVDVVATGYVRCPPPIFL